MAAVKLWGLAAGAAAAALLAAGCAQSGTGTATPTAPALRAGAPISTADWVTEEDPYYRLRFRHPPDWRVERQESEAEGPHPIIVLHPRGEGRAVSFILVSVGPAQVPAAATCSDATHETLAGFPVDICRYQRDIPTSFPLAPNEYAVRSFAWRLPDTTVYITADVSVGADPLEAPLAEAVMRTFERY